MTALVSIVTTERSDALLVPNAALRFDPGTAEAPGQEKVAEAQRAHVWMRAGPSGLSRVEVGVGASDGSVTEVVSGALTEGQQLAIGNQTAESRRTLFGLRLGF
jgi:HlyD family secretion protein